MKHNDFYEKDLCSILVPFRWDHISNKELSERWNVTVRAVQYQIKRMINLGIIQAHYSRNGRGRRMLRRGK